MMMGKVLFVTGLLWAFSLSDVQGGDDEARLITDLLENYNSNVRPVKNDNEPLKVEFQVTLREIIALDEKNQQLTTNLWLYMRWNDYKLSWDPTKYGNITDIRLPLKLLWKPDILMYNSVDPSFDGSYPVNMVLASDGTVFQQPPGIFTSACPIDIKWFPFDDQSCSMKFSSWTYDARKIDLQFVGGVSDGNLEVYARSGSWDMLGMPGIRNVVEYDCCPAPFIDLTWSINLRRRKLYYMVNIVTPCLMLAALTLVTFTIPPEAGEKISFGVTILLSLTVFLLLVAEALPATSDAVPLIALYFSVVMMMNAASVVFTVLVLNYHHRTSDTHDMPFWVKKGICEWLAWVLRLERPGHDFKSKMKCINCFPDAEEGESGNSQNGKLLARLQDEEIYISSTAGGQRSSRSDDSGQKYKTDINWYILKELRFITSKMKSQEKDDEITSDWKFAATVVDRFMLWFFTLFTVLASAAILMAAPHMFDSPPESST